MRTSFVVLSSLLYLFMAILFTNASYAQQQVYQRIYFEANPQQMLAIAQNGVPLDHLLKSGSGYQAELSGIEVALIKQQGCKVNILIDDLTSYFSDRFQNYQPSELRDAPENFHLGSHAGNLTVQEMWDELDSMRLKFPELITVKTPIGYSIENRPLYMVKVSDNADTDEEETEIEFDAMHHAREPVSMMHLIYYMWYLLENYNEDELATYLVNNREIYFIPCVNPDGYYYNQTTYPNGGGMWRKNRRNNSDGSYGVDLNRNYGYKWGYDNNGSSADPSSDVYRGTAAFSEPETQAIRDFAYAHDFASAVSCHTSGDHLIFPWGYTINPCPEVDWYSTYSEEATTLSGYDYGNVYQTLNYFANGTTPDWMYGEQTSKEKMYGFTPETGYSFWPDPGDIEDLCANILEQNIYLTWIPDAYFFSNGTMASTTYTSIVPATIQVSNIGLATGEATVTLEANSVYAIDNTDTLALSNVASLADASGELHFELDPSTPWGEQIPVTLTTSFGPFHLQESFSVTAYLSPVAVSNINSEDGFDLFPNPASGEVFLRSVTAEKSAQVTVYDVAGKKLFAETVMTNSLLHFEHLPKGIYFYTIQGTNKNTGSRKLVIQ